MLSAWSGALDLDGYCVTFVRGIDEREVLLRLGAPAESIRTMTYEEAGDLIFSSEHHNAATATASRIDDWIVLVEQNGAEGAGVGVVSGAGVPAALSVGTVMVSAFLNVNAWGVFAYARDGVLLAAYDRDKGPSSADGEDPAALGPYVERIGLENFDFENEDRDSSDPTLELAVLIAGVVPAPEDFEGELMGAYWWK